MDVYDRIDQLINSKGLSRRKLAGLAGIAPATLNSAITRKAGLSPNDLLKIASALGVDVNFLLYGRVLSELRKMQDDENYIPNEDVQRQKIQVELDDAIKSDIIRSYEQLNPLGRGLLHKDAKKYLSVPSLRLESKEVTRVDDANTQDVKQEEHTPEYNFISMTKKMGFSDEDTLYALTTLRNMQPNDLQQFTKRIQLGTSVSTKTHEVLEREAIREDSK